MEELDRLAGTDGFDEARYAPSGFFESWDFFGCGYDGIERLGWFCFCGEVFWKGSHLRGLAERLFASRSCDKDLTFTALL